MYCFHLLLASHRDSGRSDEKLKEIKVKYEKQLGELRTELKTLKSARKEHAKAMKKNVSHILWTRYLSVHMFTAYTLIQD